MNNCFGCDLCCRMYKIYIFPFEAKNIAKYLNLEYDNFVQNYLDLHIELYDVPTGAKHPFFSLPEHFFGKQIAFIPFFSLKKSSSCVFLKNMSCSIYESRPILCQLFPRFKLYDEVFNFCKIDDGSKITSIEKNKYYENITNYLQDLRQFGFFGVWNLDYSLADFDNDIYLKEVFITYNNKVIDSKELKNYFLSWIKTLSPN